METLKVIGNEVAATQSGLFGKWIASLERNAGHLSQNTINTYKASMKQYVLYLEYNGITDPTEDDVIEYRNELEKTLKPSTVQNYMAAVRKFYHWASKHGYCEDDIAEDVKSPKSEDGFKHDYLTSKQVRDILNAIDRSTLTGKRDYAMIALMVTTGLRTVSVIEADVGDIRPAGDDTVLYYKGKGHDSKDAYVKLIPEVETAIREYLRERTRPMYTLTYTPKSKAITISYPKATTSKATAPLFTSTSNNNSGGRLTTRAIRNIVKECYKAVGIDSDRLTAHSLRHTAATLNMMNGDTAGLETQQLLGHKNINTTLIYSHAIERANNSSEYRIGKAIFGNGDDTTMETRATRTEDTELEELQQACIEKVAQMDEEQVKALKALIEAYMSQDKAVANA